MVGFLQDRRPTLASWPKRIYAWEELPEPFRPALERWRASGMPLGNVTYIPKLRQGSRAREYAAAWWGQDVLVQTLDHAGVSARLFQAGGAVEYEVQLLKCTVTIHGKGDAPVSFSYNKVKEEQLRPVLSLLLGRPADLEFLTQHPEPERLGWLLEESYGMYHTALLCYRLGGELENCLYLRGKAENLLYLFQKAPDPEYFLGAMDRGLAVIRHDSYSTRVLYAPWEGLDGADLVPERRGRCALRVRAAGGEMTVPLLEGQSKQAEDFLSRLSR